MSDEQLRWANERVKELRPDYAVHHDARGWSVTSTLTFSLDGTTSTTSTQRATIVEPKRTAVEALEWAYERHNDANTQSFYVERQMRGQSLDIEPPYTEAQRARLALEEHKRRAAMQRFNEGLNRQIRWLMDKKGVTNVSKVRKALYK